MLYRIKNPQSKEWNDKKFVEAQLQDVSNENGELFKVSFWNGEITEPDGTFRPTIDGELSQNEKGYWKLTTAKKAATGQFMANQKAQAVEKVMERKETSIAKFQDSKEWSIKVASTMNKAVELAVAEYANPKNLFTLEESVLKWREWLWSNWDKDPMDKPPF
jgi:hypothetical protein